jgi:hypothetical protein
MRLVKQRRDSMESEIKIAKIESKPASKGGTLTALWDTAGNRYSGFLASLTNLQMGNIVQLNYEVNEKGFRDIKSFAPVKTPGEPKPVEAPKPEASRQDSIEAQCAAKIIADLLVAGKLEKDSELSKALAHFLSQKMAQYL